MSERPNFAARYLLTATLAATIAIAGCGSEDAESGGAPTQGPDESGNTFDAGTGQPPGADAGSSQDTSFVPEEDEFLVREVAATDNFVFVPNSSETSDTVARIDGRDLNVTPIQVADRPVAVRAAEVEFGGSTRDVAYVLCDGASAVAIIRSSQGSDPQVSLHAVPEETNAIRLSPNGKYLLAYIDPDEPLPSGTGVASLQSMALVQLGASSGEDAVHQLSVTPEITEIEFTDDGNDAFVVGRDGINHLELDEIDGDAFIPTLEVDLSASAFPPTDREVEVSGDGELLVVRSSAKAGLALYRPTGDDSSSTAQLKTIDLPGRPTDLTLTELPNDDGEDRRMVVAPIRDTRQVAFIDVDAAFDDTPTPTSDFDSPAYLDLVSVDAVEPGLARLTPDRRTALLYTTLSVDASLGALDLQERSLRSYPLRNQVRSVAIAPDGTSAVVIHEKQDGSAPAGADPVEFFQHNHGVTLVDLSAGYLRPVTLEGEPIDWLMTSNSDGVASLYAILTSGDVGGDDNDASRGLLKLDMDSFRRDFFRTARQPAQLGRVADKIFVSQEAREGRITFVDVDTGETRTVSGYQLNAGIR